MSNSIYASVMKEFRGKSSRKGVVAALAAAADDQGYFSYDRTELMAASGLTGGELDKALGELVRDRWISLDSYLRADVLMGSVRR